MYIFKIAITSLVLVVLFQKIRGLPCKTLSLLPSVLINHYFIDPVRFVSGNCSVDCGNTHMHSWEPSENLGLNAVTGDVWLCQGRLGRAFHLGHL